MSRVLTVFHALTCAQARGRLFLALALMLCTSIARATTWQVPGGAPTIQAGIDSASGIVVDTVELTGLSYTGVGNHDIDYRGKAVVVRSQSGDPNLCRIDCQNSGRGFIFNTNEGPGSVLEGVTITNGGAVNYGGAVSSSSSSPTIRNCTFRVCRANIGGGAVNCYNNSSPSFTNCRIDSNFAVAYGGGVCCEASSSPTFTDCHIDYNISGNKGGGVECWNNASPTFSGCTISHDSAGFGGGVASGNNSSPTFINDCHVFNNIGYLAGGGVYTDSSGTFTFTDSHLDANLTWYDGGGASGGGSFTNCTINYNNASTGGGLSVGFYSLTGCSLSGNHADLIGGGACIGYGALFDSCTISDNSTYNDGGGVAFVEASEAFFSKCKIDRNHADVDGGGIYCPQQGSNPVFWNCQFDSNSADGDGGGFYGWGGNPPYLPHPSFVHCTFARNSARSLGGGAYGYYSLDFRNTIIAFSNCEGVYIQNYDTNWVWVAYCDFFGNPCGDVVGAPPAVGQITTTNANGDSCDQFFNIFLDPSFVDTSASNLHLSDYSHCIGAALSTTGVNYDIEGNPRPNPSDSNPDIGAFENSLGIPAVPPVTDLVISIQSGNAVLNWSPVGAATYNIYGAITPFTPGTLLVNVTGTTWTDINTSSRPSPYFYYVTGQ